MARQSTTPVTFNRTMRMDRVNGMTSGRAGKVLPITFVPLFAGDSASGRVGLDVELAEMPRPLKNGVMANFQAWLVPKMALPQFAGFDDYMHSLQETDIKTKGGADRTPPVFFETIDGTDLTTTAASEFFETLGLHVVAGTPIHTDLIDAFWMVYNFRLAAHSSKLELSPYASEDLASSTALPRAFWPKSAMTKTVPDYEAALVVGNLDLDVSAGQLDVTGIGFFNGLKETPGTGSRSDLRKTNESTQETGNTDDWVSASVNINGDGFPEVFADLTGSVIPTTLADIDKARTTQAFATLRAAYAGNDTTGYANDDTIVAMLMSGMKVPQDEFRRPILLDSNIVPFNFVERFASDAANLDASVSQGRASAQLSLNVPEMPCDGTIIVTVEVMPELLQEAMSDEWLHMQSPSDRPDALRDIQRTEPVDMVLNRRRDSRHTEPGQLYGYEPMNERWNRNFTRLGGVFKQDDPANPFSEQRNAIWQASVVDPTFTGDHWLVPEDLSHAVFSDTEAPAFELVYRHDVSISGLTQMGDMLDEDNSNFVAVQDAQIEEEA